MRLTVRVTTRSDAKAGRNDPPQRSGCARGLSDKSYPRDNRLIAPKRPQRRGGLAPRCRLIASWGGSTSQGSVCSPVKAVRELGSERRETADPDENRDDIRTVSHSALNYFYIKACYL